MSSKTPASFEIPVGQLGLDALDEPGVADHGVRDDQDPARALLRELEPGALDQAAAGDDPRRRRELEEVLEAAHLALVERQHVVVERHQAPSRSSRLACWS